MWDSTQTPHRAKTVMVQTLGLLEHQVRVVAPDVGGGFGPKAVFHPEEIAIPAAALLLRRPIKWIEDRLESFTATVQERRQIWDVEAAFDAEGKLGGIRGRLYHDHGANVPYGVALPYNGVTNMIGPYVLPALASRGLAVPDQYGAGGADARRRPAARHLRDGAHPRPHRQDVEPYARRGAAAQSHCAGARCPTRRRSSSATAAS